MCGWGVGGGGDVVRGKKMRKRMVMVREEGSWLGEL